MQKAQILMIGRNAEIVAVVERLINANPRWQATACLTDEAALAACQKQPFDLVLLGGGVDEMSEAQLRERIEMLHPGTRIIQHYGGGSGLLATEIRMAIGDW
jgi:DNA-binding NtrC family response regulator